MHLQGWFIFWKNNLNPSWACNGGSQDKFWLDFKGCCLWFLKLGFSQVGLNRDLEKKQQLSFTGYWEKRKKCSSLFTALCGQKERFMQGTWEKIATYKTQSESLPCVPALTYRRVTSLLTSVSPQPQNKLPSKALWQTLQLAGKAAAMFHEGLCPHLCEQY